jgi:signal transduction histidine kinase/CheY-like chemotaxis protein
MGDWELDLVTGVIHRSLRHDRCFGFTELQPRWDVSVFASRVHPADQSTVLQHFHNAISKLTGLRFECRVIWPDGSLHWIGVHGSMYYEQGRAGRMLGIVNDITDQKNAESARMTTQQLRAENEQIQEANRLKSQFLANMSHELRTPLNAIIGFAELLHAGAVSPSSPRHHEFLGHIGNSGRHLLGLINDILDLAKVESGKVEFAPRQVDLTELIGEVVQVLQPSIDAKRIALATEIDWSIGKLFIDPTRMKQALFNYLSNAIKFTPEGGHVTVRALPEGAEQFRIEVEDTGAGIEEADLHRLFIEFQQLDSGYSKKHEGTGLGLALTRRLIQAQGGEVGVRSTVGKGSVFYLVLNRIQRRRESTAGAITQSPAAVDKAAARFLVIADDSPAQTGLVDGLRHAGHQADAAANSVEARLMNSKAIYDAFTLDLTLADCRGLELLAQLRSSGPNEDSPVVGVSMLGNAGGTAAFSIADVLTKPIRTEEIVRALARCTVEEDRRVRVLVIDDDPLALELMKVSLAGLGLDVYCELDARAALAKLEDIRPDSIVLDLMMPDFDGFATLAALHELPGWRETPVYIWTSMVLTDAEYETLSQSAAAIINKGGGALAPMLNRLSNWHPAEADRPIVPDADGAPPPTPPGTAK